ncbi:MAG TPA: alpha-1,4-glucan--maltose-1-phosphate maltosyltransferase [Intrasporangium sp.]|uniref:alpha-1,4-glucan--maltose-1-phosphate maltosyltransferase n=1 Tax=Intrasporangium sp. TaxID=1925024 RepID=UPI002D76F10D|nr:alpha-1,4-glucan--maltose-1-phosphate maltosyltransferase [Intrasporangium sp.]HET7399194.1 alpha-1,4-glucan--maltose-1-phosphate maltosyltransferase [Intrasporangium sp.]
MPGGAVPFGRIPVMGVRPLVDCGARPAKSVVGEEFVVRAKVFREGHDAVNATTVLTAPDGTEHYFGMHCDNVGLSEWSATVSAGSEGWWTYRVEGWSDPYATWVHDAEIKIGAGIDEELMCAEGVKVLDRFASSVRGLDIDASAIEHAADALRDTSRPAADRLALATSADVRGLHSLVPLREFVSPTPRYSLLVERERALYGAWYEMFPRSEGAWRDPETGAWTSGTLRTAARRLPGIADMLFDVVYLTPIHPIGTTARKGRNNTLVAQPGDPGSPYAIGSPDGGHDAIHPDLGTFEDFDYFVATARHNGLEVALDIALQASPDHPWVKTHPELFTTRADGSIAYAENPPKKYQDIYPLNFDNDPAGAYAEVRRVIQVWLDHGVRIFRVDNPHTKPVAFWQWLIADVAKDYPEVIWLSEAFTKPAMMHALAMAGFQQSYTYYAWRNAKWELEEYGRELAGDAAAYMRPSFWPTTHDILTPYMQFGGPTAWKLRAALAATMVPTYGIYAGYELMEDVARPGAEEQADNEKYEYKDRQWYLYEPGRARSGQSLAGYLRRINEIRREHPALHWLRNLVFHHADDENILVFSKTRVVDGARDTILVVANVDPHSTRETFVRLDLEAMGMATWSAFTAHELITDQSWEWRADNFVRLGPDAEPIHIIHVRSH